MNNMEVAFEILKHCGVIRNATNTGWTKEANIVSWNGGPPKLDIREWDADHERMTRGITLWDAEAKSLISILKENLPSKEEFPKEGGLKTPGEFSVDIVMHLGKIADIVTREVPWTKEVNIVSWNGAPPKVDIRDWDTETHERMTHGITLTRDEALELSKIKLNASDFKVDPPAPEEDEEDENIVPKIVDTLIDRLMGTDGVEFERLSTGEIKVDSENGADTIHLTWDKKPIEISVKEAK